MTRRRRLVVAALDVTTIVAVALAIVWRSAPLANVAVVLAVLGLVGGWIATDPRRRVSTLRPRPELHPPPLTSGKSMVALTSLLVVELVELDEPHEPLVRMRVWVTPGEPCPRCSAPVPAGRHVSECPSCGLVGSMGVTFDDLGDVPW